MKLDVFFVSNLNQTNPELVHQEASLADDLGWIRILL